MPFLAKFDGKCIKCGGPVIGFIKHGQDNAMNITWPRRGAVKGQIEHVSPTCDEVSRGIMTRDEKRNGYAPDYSETEQIENALETVQAPETASASSDATNVTAQVLQALKAAGVAIPESISATLTAKTPAKKIRATNKSEWFVALSALLDSGAARILLVGPPGTGKSRTTELIGESKGKGYRITMTEGTGVEDLLGMFQLVSDGKTSKTQWVDGPAARALREGALLQLDEVTHTPPEIESLLYALMDDNPQIMLPNGEHLRASSGYAVIATTNDNAAQLEPALMDRCEAILLAVAPHTDALKDCSAASRAAVLAYYRAMDVTPWQFSRPPQVRPVRSFEKLRKSGLLDDELLARVVFGESGREFLSVITTSASKGGK